MKTLIGCLSILSTFLCGTGFAAAQGNDAKAGYVIRHEGDLLKKGPAPNKGTGEVVGCAFFDDLKDFNISFRKRVLQNGASLGKHMQTHDEIYYVVSGHGTVRINDAPYPVNPGDAVLTKKGNSHQMIQTSKEDLVILVIFVKEQ
jgi:mannose-6-phosphate isomerase-like protein (cupin superfamily)